MALIFWLSEPVIEPLFLIFKKWAIAKSVPLREFIQKVYIFEAYSFIFASLREGSSREAKI